MARERPQESTEGPSVCGSAQKSTSRGEDAHLDLPAGVGPGERRGQPGPHFVQLLQLDQAGLKAAFEGGEVRGGAGRSPRLKISVRALERLPKIGLLGIVAERLGTIST